VKSHFKEYKNKEISVKELAYIFCPLRVCDLCPVEQLITEHRINMAATSKPDIK
jgi:hypothetical protein